MSFFLTSLQLLSVFKFVLTILTSIRSYFSSQRDINEDDFLQPVTLVVRAIQYDNQDRYALATLVLSKAGTSLRELQFSKNEYSVTALENLPVNYVLLTVSTNKPRDPVSARKTINSKDIIAYFEIELFHVKLKIFAHNVHF